MEAFLNGYGTVFFIAMLPLAELRGAIPAGIAMGLSPGAVWAVSVIGNMVPVFFIIRCIRVIFQWMKRQGRFLSGFITCLDKKAARNARLFYRYELLGLFFLVAVPLPGTGAWTGALVSVFLDIRLKAAVPVIAAGVCAAGLAVLAITCGLCTLFVC